MSQAQLAASSDRLPWLTDDPTPVPNKPAPRGGKGRRVAAAAIAVAALAASSYWLGTQSWRVPESANGSNSRSTTVALPPASNPQQQVQLAPTPEVTPPIQPLVRQAPQQQVSIARPQQQETQAAETEEASASGEVGPPSLDAAPSSPTTATAPPPAAASPAPAVTRAPAPAKPALNKFPATVQRRGKTRAAARPAPLTLWPARVSSGAYGRLVQIGAFGTKLQAKQGWQAMVRAYPGVKRLPAVVVETRNSRGRPFYRFQIGTTSQAHSEVLCQRMEKIRFSCAVVGLPQKPRGIER